MPHGEVSEIIPASASAVFDLLHDYDRRLEWDTLLQSARLHAPHTSAVIAAVSTCKGRPVLGGIALTTEYIRFAPGEIAAIRMLNKPPFFESFAASIRHENIADGASKITYKFTFTARPRCLRWLQHPVMGVIFRFETKKRLAALRRHFSKQEEGLNPLEMTQR